MSHPLQVLEQVELFLKLPVDKLPELGDETKKL